MKLNLNMTARILDCGGRAQRRHRFSDAPTPSKAAWRSASRRSPKDFGCGCAALRSLAVIATSFLFAGTAAHAQVNSGSNGSDGALDLNSSFVEAGNFTNMVIDMHDHPGGVYQYTYINIPYRATVTFIPNANNTPVVWLVQSNCVIDGIVSVSGQNGNVAEGGQGGPGGWRGGNGGVTATSGYGPGGGLVGEIGGSASYGGLGSTGAYAPPPGPTYGNTFLIPLQGGSGGGGNSYSASPTGGGGGGGAILIAASDAIMVSGFVIADGGANGNNGGWRAGGGSGGAVRFIASTITGAGMISTVGGNGAYGRGGSGRVRFDSFANNFAGQIAGALTQGFQPIIIPTAGQGAQLTVTSVGGVPVSASPTGVLSTPDAVLSAQQNNPIPILVHCSNIPLNTQITVSVKPANGAAVSATGLNSSGTLSSSTATVLINMPRGGGLIYATAATGN